MVERHISPDGLLQLVVDHADDGDWTVGFDGFAWHTHGDVLEAGGYAGTAEQRVRAFVDDVVGSRCVIVISRIDRRIRDARVTDGPARDESTYAEPNETIEKRHWNGQRAAG